MDPVAMVPARQTVHTLGKESACPHELDNYYQIRAIIYKGIAARNFRIHQFEGTSPEAIRSLSALSALASASRLRRSAP
jgi:hypothetical protein